MSRLIVKIFVILLAALICRADNYEKTVSSLGENSKNTYLDFLSQTMEQRLSFIYNDGKLSEHQEKFLVEASRKYTEVLQQILKEQLDLKKQIEDYTGDDWEEKFGSSGIWNKLKAHISNTQSRLSQIGNSKTFQHQNSNDNDFETNAGIAFTQLKSGSDEHLQKTIEKWPQSRELFGRLALEKFVNQDNLSSITQTEVILACESAIKNPQDYSQFLLKLTKRFQIPVVYYTAALSIEKENPLQAMEFFTEAGKNKENPFARDSAKRAAIFAYNLYNEKLIDCGKTIAAFENYIQQNSNDYDALYSFAAVLKNCGKKEKAVEILEQIIKSSNQLTQISEYDSIMLKFELENDYQQTEKKLENLLEKITQNDELHNSVLQTHCKFILSHETTDGAKKVLLLLKNRDMPALKARAYWILGRKEQVVNELARIKIFNDEEADFCRFALEDIVKNIDELSETCGKNFFKNCAALAEQMNAGLLALEFQLAIPDSNEIENIKAQINKLEKQKGMENSDFLRLYARFYTKTGNFQKAYELWSQLVSQQSPQWSARYYQILCLSRLSEKSRKEATHAAEVLLNSKNDISPFWRQKLLNLTI